MHSASPRGLYDPRAGHAHCGVGAVVALDGTARHCIVEDGFRLLDNLDHRGARGAEENTGDGAGMLLQQPHRFLARQVEGLPEPDGYGVGQVFLPREHDRRRRLRALIEEITEREGLRLLAWRDVPTDNSGLGATALASEPVSEQFFVAPGRRLTLEALDAALYVLRCQIQNAARAADLLGEGSSLFYICSLHRRRLVYKGLLTCAQLRSYYPDLSDPDFESALVLVHSRFSTNTLGAWELAHPYRTLVHNGEFNTLRGNVNWMRAREADLAHPRFGEAIERVKPVLAVSGQSDSADFDHVLELLVESGRSLPHALRMLVPEAWNRDPLMNPERRAFYEYYSTLMEPWDGPALVVATDGDAVGAILDRNGLRPCRYCRTRDGRLILASETGTLETAFEDIVEQGRLRPGQMFLADTRSARVVPEDEVFGELTGAAPYAEWLERHRRVLSTRIDDSAADPEPPPEAELLRLQHSFGYTMEALRVLLRPMAAEGKDPLGAMGDDAPPAALSAQHKPLFNYFLQQFAQVSNPPLDYIRESLVTALESHLGRQRNLLDETPEHCRQLFLASPVLSDAGFQALRTLTGPGLTPASVDATLAPGSGLQPALERLREAAAEAVGAGHELLILDDRAAGPARVAIPALLAVAAVHHALVRRGLRSRTGLVVASGHATQVHHFCTLIGYGADAVYPWLAYRSVDAMARDGGLGEAAEARERYRAAVDDGILKVMSKMGISTLESYKGAQIFETVGLATELVDEYFPGTAAHIPGLDIAGIEHEAEATHREAYAEAPAASLPLPPGGDFYWRRDGEAHQWNPLTIGQLQHAARCNEAGSYRRFARAVNEQDERLQTLRGLLEPVPDAGGPPVPLEEVEPAAAILRRFSTGSMSFGALSREAHEAMAVAMNRIGGKAGSGEGGEQVERFGTEAENSMKQVASGRFGVTAHYLASARQIEIKMAQGSKPGEGGELPGGKVGPEIAEVRFTVPGVGLISPPPHHDIYSIEDLAQLIHDLKCANPDAEVHVKLVSKANIGTIAAGVAKGRADAILISGNAGGTGASKKTSIKQAGTPWELGLAETHQVLMANRLRSRVRLRADGGFKTGRDVVVAALLGAEEYGFGTAPMVVVGCIMLRKCHCNTCSVGVATQDPRLRARFDGRPEHIVNYLRFVAEDVRGLMAALGFRRLDDMIGRADCLRPKPVTHPRDLQLDLSALLYRQDADDTPRKVREQNHGLDGKLDHELLRQAAPALERGEPVCISARVRNRDRTVGTLLSSALAKRHGARMLPPGTIRVALEGSAGQSLGAFLAAGVSIDLAGDANDYVGKGLSGGRLAVRVPPGAGYRAADNVIIGNVALYGATAGEAYFNGRAGERFCVRNSGALAVVEGIGDHGCEYMTGGAALILGPVGRNFAAGMSGGEAFVLDPAGELEQRLNPEMVTTERLRGERDRAMVHRLLENHRACTGSTVAARLLDAGEQALDDFVKVIPEAYAEVVERYRQQGEDIRVPIPEPLAVSP